MNEFYFNGLSIENKDGNLSIKLDIRSTGSSPVDVPPVEDGTLKFYTVGGIRGTVFSLEKTKVAVGEELWFHIQAVNDTNRDIQYGVISLKAEEGPGGASYTHETLTANGGTLPGPDWRDHIKFTNPGTYHVYLGLGPIYDQKDGYLSGVLPWSRLSSSLTLTVTP